MQKPYDVAERIALSSRALLFEVTNFYILRPLNLRKGWRSFFFFSKFINMKYEYIFTVLFTVIIILSAITLVVFNTASPEVIELMIVMLLILIAAALIMAVVEIISHIKNK